MRGGSVTQPEPPHILLATLGSQPQIVTFALDLLLAQSIPISQVMVVHPANYPGLPESFARLNAEFVEDRYQFNGRPLTIHLRRRVLQWYDQPIADIVDEQSADHVLNAMDRLLRELKQGANPYIVHFLISGGRRLISFLSITAAMLNFDTPDRLWHLYTPETVRERVRNSGLMHVTPADGVRLIRVPFASLSQPLLKHTLQGGVNDASTFLRIRNRQQEAEERARCQRVIDQLTRRQREVLQAFASGLDAQQVAQKLNITPATVSTHTNRLLTICREVWPDESFHDYRSMRHKFTAYFSDE